MTWNESYSIAEYVLHLQFTVQNWLPFYAISYNFYDKLVPYIWPLRTFQRQMDISRRSAESRNPPHVVMHVHDLLVLWLSPSHVPRRSCPNFQFYPKNNVSRPLQLINRTELWCLNIYLFVCGTIKDYIVNPLHEGSKIWSVSFYLLLFLR